MSGRVPECVPRGLAPRGTVLIAVARNIAAKLVDAVGQPFALRDGARVSIGASVGVVSSHGLPGQLAVLLRRADAAMYEAKKDGKSQYRIAFPA